MKIDYAIVSCDNSWYQDYWPVVSQAWRRIGITPVIVRLGDKYATNKTKDFIEIEVPFIEGYRLDFQAKISRVWAFKLLTGNCIISDMDMLPISSEYFNGTAAKYNEKQIVSYCSDAAEKFDGCYPMCYILAESGLFSSLIKADNWVDFLDEATYNPHAPLQKDKILYSSDQSPLKIIVDRHTDVVHLHRGFNQFGMADNRIDRIDWRYDEQKVIMEKYYDAHLLRPYKGNEEKINKLASLLKWK